MLPSAPGVAVITNWFGSTTAAASTAGALQALLFPLIWLAMLFRMVAALVPWVSEAAAEPSELDTAIGPATPSFSVIRISLLYWPPTVAVQFGSVALICAATLAAICALFSVPS